MVLFAENLSCRDEEAATLHIMYVKRSITIWHNTHVTSRIYLFILYLNCIEAIHSIRDCITYFTHRKCLFGVFRACGRDHRCTPYMEDFPHPIPYHADIKWTSPFFSSCEARSVYPQKTSELSRTYLWIFLSGIIRFGLLLIRTRFKLPLLTEIM